MDAPGVSNKKRLKIALWFMMVLLLLLIARLVKVMVIDSEELENRAASQQTRNTTLSATRGKILDSTGVVLARNATAYKVVIWPSSIKDDEKERVAKELSSLLDMDYAKVLEKVNANKQEIVLARQVERETVDKIESMKLGIGVGTAIDTKRYYSSGSLFSQLLGFTNIDGEGQAGLEQKYEKYLAGKNGRMVTETDGKQNPLPYGVQEIIEATDGCDLILTTDAVMQSALEKACKEALEVNKAASVQGVIMDCTTGEIKAMTTQPDFDPNSPPRNDMALLNSLMRNRVVTDSYEPGSTFKLITLSAALDSHTVNTGTGFYCDGGCTVNGERIKCWRSGGHGSQTLYKAVQNSCNPSFVKMALSMGTETFYDYIYSFGFGSSTGSGITGESAGIVTHQKYITENTLARIGFGHSIAVTPLQLVTAVSAAVNGGKLMQPYVVDSIVAPDGTVVLKNEPKVVRRVISEETSALVRDIGESVVSEGSGKNAAIPGYRIGGKTGTAQKYGADGKIAQGKLIASFIGFAPADEPKYVCLILVDEPQVGTIFGSTVAAPFVKQVMEEVLRYAGYLPEQASTSVTVPAVTDITVAEAKRELEKIGLTATYQDDENEIVTAQVPIEGKSVQAGSGVLLYTAMTSAPSEDISGEQEDEMVIVPDVFDKTKLEANDALKAKGLIIKIDPPDQSGKAIRQSPAAGETVPKGTEVLVEFSNTGIG
ncbi:MAG TPA: penicillin-binding transpeptidase domain-containing protein [Clostridia bacterium]|nr:PASTA domain-containing protein [Clostridiales bacterium]MDY5693743.1 penicillin-binding transpeptidase domain-containing protein [Eubacteriales bacterium]HZK45688.1 penicillin-binding transpeptidase domain-containing protein [Clostridia bacterium]